MGIYNLNPNFKISMSNKIPNPNDKKYDLVERTAKFGEDIISFAGSLPDTSVTKPLINQLIRSGASIGANYMEADGAESKKDFEHKIGISRKESKETMHWLRMVARAVSMEQESCRKLWKEAQEFVFIFSSIINNSKNKKV